MAAAPEAVIRILGRRSAFNVQKVLWLLGELELAHEQVEVGGAAGGLDEPSFLALNPHGRIPVLCDGPDTVWESHAILRYLAARYGEEALYPPDPLARSQVDRWMDWAHTALQPAFMALFWGYYRTPEPQRSPRHVEAARRDCARQFEQLDAQLATRPYLAGPAFSLGDIPAATTLYRYFTMGLDVPEPPHVRAWYERMQARPAFREHVMRSYEELRGRVAH